MEEVLKQAGALAHAILESEEYTQMRLAEQAAMQNEEAVALIAAYQEKQQEVESHIRGGSKDPAALAAAGAALQEARKAIDENAVIQRMQSTNEAFQEMMKKVNNLIQYVVTGEMPEEGGCSGNCSSCGGCH